MSASAAVRYLLVTGASRGLGLEFVRQYSAIPNTHVIATARNIENAAELQALKNKHSNIQLLEFDVVNEEQVKKAIASLTIPYLNILINNAGIVSPLHPTESILATRRSDIMSVYEANVAGTLTVTQACLPLLTKSPSRPTVVNLSSTMASIKNTYGGSASYRCSKAALNMLTVNFSIEVPNINFIALSPGWVQTDMGSKGGQPPLKPEQSIAGMIEVIDDVEKKQYNGKFLDYDGRPLDW